MMSRRQSPARRSCSVRPLAPPFTDPRRREVMNHELSPLTAEFVLRKPKMKPRLLATDPDPILLGIWRAYFLNFGFDVVTAVDGMHCAALFRDVVPDVMILSFELWWGGADGVLSIVREDDKTRPVP